VKRGQKSGTRNDPAASSSVEKIGAASKRGGHDHTTAPRASTSAEHWQLPIRPSRSRGIAPRS
jgi:hypothetical protein